MTPWLFALHAGRGVSHERLAPRQELFVSEPSDALVAQQQGREARPSRADGVLVCAWDAPGDAVMLPDAHGYRVEEVVHWDDGGDLSRGLVVFYFLRRREDLSQEEFVRRYREGHAPLARAHHPGIARYVQRFVLACSEDAPAWHAIAALHFRTEDEFRGRFYRDETSPGVVAEDVRRFADLRSGLVLVTRPRAA